MTTHVPKSFLSEEHPRSVKGDKKLRSSRLSGKMLVIIRTACFVAVITAVFAQSSVRFSGGSGTAGAVEVLVNGEWGKVCADGFSHVDAAVVCQQLTNTGVASLEDGKYTTPQPFVIADLHCNGDETSILQCPFEQSSTCPSGRAAGVSCGEGVTGTLGLEIGIIAGIAVTLMALIGIGALVVGCLYRNQCWRGPTLA